MQRSLLALVISFGSVACSGLDVVGGTQPAPEGMLTPGAVSQEFDENGPGLSPEDTAMLESMPGKRVIPLTGLVDGLFNTKSDAFVNTDRGAVFARLKKLPETRGHVLPFEYFSDGAGVQSIDGYQAWVWEIKSDGQGNCTVDRGKDIGKMKGACHHRQADCRGECNGYNAVVVTGYQGDTKDFVPGEYIDRDMSMGKPVFVGALGKIPDCNGIDWHGGNIPKTTGGDTGNNEGTSGTGSSNSGTAGTQGNTGSSDGSGLF